MPPKARLRLPAGLRSVRKPAGGGAWGGCSPRASVLEFGPGDVVFRQGDKGDRLFIVKSGVLEILAQPRPMRTEAAGHRLPGAGRGAGRDRPPDRDARAAPPSAPPSARSCSRIEKAVFLDLMDTLPAFARNLCIVLAKRLETTTLKVPRASGKQLQGNLQVLRPRHRHPDPDRLPSDGKPGGDPGGRQDQDGRDLLLQGQHRPGQVQAAHGRRRGASSSSRASSRATSPSRARWCRKTRCRPTSPCPRSPCSWSRCACRTSCPGSRSGCRIPTGSIKQKSTELQVGGAGDRGARGLRLGAPQEGRFRQRPPPRRAALLVRHLPDPLHHGGVGDGGLTASLSLALSLASSTARARP